MPFPKLKYLAVIVTATLGLLVVTMALICIIAIIIYPRLPSLDQLTDYRPKIPLRVFTADGYLIGEFGEERRKLTRIADTPEVMKQAILAAEDERFYQHAGVDLLGIGRAAYANLTSGGKKQGASTITMQVARNFFLSSEKTLTRKLYEALLSFKIETSLSKDQILELYINQIYLGQRAYGFASAAQIYFGKPLADITTAEAAMLAGLPKAPSAFNPVVNPKRARIRQLYVLHRMQELAYISGEEYAKARDEVLHVKHDINDFGIHAEYAAEMARQIAFDRYHDEAYSMGLRVFTTLRKADQVAAYESVRRGALDYDKRHGYRGAEAFVELNGGEAKLSEDMIEEHLQDFDEVLGLLPALVVSATPTEVKAHIRGGEKITLGAETLKFGARMLDAKAPANRRIRAGAVIRVAKDAKGIWQLAQLPDVEAALVAADPVTGEIRALVGGIDFNRSKFNHVTQAWRQPGSSFKPFVYSAAMEKGYSPASIVADEPITITAEETGSQTWEPKNYDGKYDGPMTLRTALARSKNMVSIRLLKSIGTHYAQDYVTRFGFDSDKNPPYLTLALGAGLVTPWQQVAAYSVFANGGYKIEPFIVSKITDNAGQVLGNSQPQKAGTDELRIIDARNAYMLDSMLKDVVRRGTATRAAAVLKRGDLAGKTGTTNDYIDAWFCGYQPTVVAVAWIGFDQPKRLGSGETGGHAALPMWIGYMEKVLKGVPETYPEKPSGLTEINGADPALQREVQEFIYTEHLPPVDPESGEHNKMPVLRNPFFNSGPTP